MKNKHNIFYVLIFLFIAQTYSKTGIFLSFDDPRSVKEKVEYANKYNLKGVMAWHIGLDRTGELIETADKTLGDKKELIIYFQNFMTGKGKNSTLEEIEELLKKDTKITSLIYCFLKPNADGTVEFDRPILDASNKEKLKQLKTKFPHLKVLLSIGGWGYQKIFFEVARNQQLRRLAYNSVKALADIFDGIDIDWEFHASEFEEFKQEYPRFVQFVLQAIQAEGNKKIVTLALPHNARFYQNFPDLKKLSEKVSWINMMTYNYEGPNWSEVTAHNAPLYSPKVVHRRRWKKERPTFESVDTTVQAFLKAGVKEDKLVMGIPFYGRSFAGVTQKVRHDGLYELHTGPAKVMSPVSGVFIYAGLQNNVPLIEKETRNGWTYYWDDECKVPYLFNPTGVV